MGLPRESEWVCIIYTLVYSATNYFNGGEGGIRTHGNRKATHALQACLLDHSSTSPRNTIVAEIYSEFLVTVK